MRVSDNGIFAKFSPQDDITVYELAKITAELVVIDRPASFGVRFDKEIWESLPQAIKRHFWFEARV